MTIWDYMMEYCDGEMDQDVTDSELDIWVAFCCDSDMENSSDTYDRFITLLAKNVQLSCLSDIPETQEGILRCDFSGWAEQFNDKIRETMKKNHGHFQYKEPDGAYLNFVSDLEALISGQANDPTYQMWLDTFTKEK
jgi:hypothetical protein